MNEALIRGDCDATRDASLSCPILKFPTARLRVTILLYFFLVYGDRYEITLEEVVGGRLGHFVGLDFDRGIRDDRSTADTEKARLVPTTAWAVIEGQGERVTENERGGHVERLAVLGP